jgi:transposase
VTTCEASEVNPEEYLADVLMRMQTHPDSRIGELLPHAWKRLRVVDSS